MKKGFTLIELMAVIVIISVVAIVTFPSIVNQIKKSKDKNQESVNSIIISAAKKYVNDNPNDFEEQNDNNYCIKIVDLIDNDYLKEDIINSEEVNIDGEFIKFNPDGNYEITNKCSSYTKLNYIKSTGTQYINTNYYPSQDTSIEFVFETTDKTSTFALFGGRDSGGSLSFAMWQTGSKFRFDYKNLRATSNAISLDTKYKVYQNKNLYYVDNTLVNEFNYSEFESPSPIILLGIMSSGRLDERKAKIKLYSCKIWDNDDLIRDYIPVLDSEGVPCLYDKVEKKYYYNEGTLEFLYE